MKWPFVFRSLFEYQERELSGLKQELVEVKKENRRVVDEINFRSTGFHLYPEFESKAVPEPMIPVAQAAPSTGLAASIDAVGTRGSALRKHMEATSTMRMNQEEKQWADAAEQRRQAEASARATDLLESALKKGSDRAAQA